MILIHYGELVLKGKNRDQFIRKLSEDIKRRLSLKKDDVEMSYGRMVIKRELDEAINRKLEKMAGIANFAEVTEVEAETDEIKKAVLRMAKDHKGSFAIRCKRIDKSFVKDSQQMNREIGALVKEKYNREVNLDAPAQTIIIEIAAGHAYIYGEKFKGMGGLPVGSSGKLMVLLSGGIDSPVAAVRMIKRGAKIGGVHFHSYPRTGKESIEKIKKLGAKIASFGGGMEIIMVPLLPIQEEIAAKCNPKYRVILYRRMMLKIAEKLAEREGYQGLVTGESLGQVASQTIESITATNEAVSLPILRPLIGTSKAIIMAEAKIIETYALSILPHEDCCSLFVPKHPITKPKLTEVLAEESKLDVVKQINTAIKQVKREKIEA